MILIFFGIYDILILHYLKEILSPKDLKKSCFPYPKRTAFFCYMVELANFCITFGRFCYQESYNALSFYMFFLVTLQVYSFLYKSFLKNKVFINSLTSAQYGAHLHSLCNDCCLYGSFGSSPAIPYCSQDLHLFPV